MAIKTVLKPEIQDRLWESEGLCGMLAEKLKTTTANVRRKVKGNGPTILLPHALKEIREVLGLPEDEVITDTIEVVEKEYTHLHE